MSFTLSLAHFTVLDATPPQVVEVAHAAGFRSIGLRLSPARRGEQPHPMQEGGPMMRETLARMQALDVAVHDVEVIRIGPDFDVRAYAGVLASAQQLGARYLAVNVDDDDEQRVAEGMARLAEAAAPHGLRAGLEFMVYSAASSLAQAQRMVAAAAHPGAVVMIDALHLFRAGSQPEELGAHFARDYLQINDAPLQRHPGLSAGEEGRAYRLLPGEGALRLDALLQQAEPSAVLSVEAPNAIRAATLSLADRARLAYARTADFLKGVGYAFQ